MGVGPAPTEMQVRPDQLAAHLARGLRRIYTVHGDEALLAQEAADAIRAAARGAGCSERQVHTVTGQHFDWSGLLGAAQSMSLFAERQLIEIRIPSGIVCGHQWTMFAACPSAGSRVLSIRIRLIGKLVAPSPSIRQPSMSAALASGFS